MAIGRTELKDAPTTPMRIIMGIVAAFIYVMVLIGCLVAQIDVSETLAGIIGTFILLQEGLDVTQWGIKRSTDRELNRIRAGSTPTVEVTSEHTTVTAEPPAAPTEPAPLPARRAATARDLSRRPTTATQVDF